MRVMPPRLSLRRLFCVVVLCGAGILVLQNVRQNWYYSGNAPGGESMTIQQDQLRGNEIHQGTNGHTTTTLAGGDNNGNEVAYKQELEVPEVKEKLWFMKGGTLRPTPAQRDP